MRILMLGAALMLLSPAFVTAAPAPGFGPRMDLANLPSKTYAIDVPAGYVLVFDSHTGVSLAPLGTLSTRGPPAGCLAVARVGWVSEGVVDCGATYVSHVGRLSSVTLVVAGGAGFADALNLASFFNYYFISCDGPVAIGRGVGSCSEFGNPSLGFNSWDARTSGDAVALSLYQ